MWVSHSTPPSDNTAGPVDSTPRLLTARKQAKENSTIMGGFKRSLVAAGLLATTTSGYLFSAPSGSLATTSTSRALGERQSTISRRSAPSPRMSTMSPSSDTAASTQAGPAGERSRKNGAGRLIFFFHLDFRGGRPSTLLVICESPLTGFLCWLCIQYFAQTKNTAGASNLFASGLGVLSRRFWRRALSDLVH